MAYWCDDEALRLQQSRLDAAQADALTAMIDAAVARFPWPKAHFAKRGRNPAKPYVPIMDYGEQEIGVHRTRTEQIMGLAYATADEAKRRAQRQIDAHKAAFAAKLRESGMRTLRKQWGLPQEIEP